MKLLSLGIIAVSAVMLASCATQTGLPIHDAPGFLMGFFHGFTAIFSLIGSLFLRVRIYASPNSGFWYDFGFVAGFFSSLLAAFLASMARVGGLVS